VIEGTAPGFFCGWRRLLSFPLSPTLVLRRSGHSVEYERCRNECRTGFTVDVYPQAPHIADSIQRDIEQSNGPRLTYAFTFSFTHRSFFQFERG